MKEVTTWSWQRAMQVKVGKKKIQKHFKNKGT